MNKYFIKFKPETSEPFKVMPVFMDSRNQAFNLAIKVYGETVMALYSENELGTMHADLLQIYNQLDFGSQVSIRTYNCEGKEIVKTYPFTFTPVVNLNGITSWFKTAKPNPTSSNVVQQLHYHFEEVAELVKAIDPELKLLGNLHHELEATKFLVNYDEAQANELLKQSNTVEVFDALCDQIVTSTGLGYMLGLPMEQGINEVNQSNHSKFENGQALINDEGKIIKGKYYRKPNLEQFLRG